MDASALGLFGMSAGGATETFMCIVVAMVVLRLELQRQVGTGPNLGSRQWYAASCKRLLKECAPEAAGLMACLTLAAALRARGDTRESEAADSEAWEQIKAQWPLLLTADTLLSLQAMLRLVVLLSLVVRSGGQGPVPLSDEASALWLLAGLARVALLLRSGVYTLDGPLGGGLPAACEIAVVPMLFQLSRGVLRRQPLAVASVLATAVSFARRNHLALAGEQVADGLFLLAHSLDCLAAFAFLLRTMLIDGTGGVSVAFAHLLMPIQQGFAAYYFLQAFDYSPELVGSGIPFEVLQIGNTAAFGAYLGASALYFAESLSRRPIDQAVAVS